MSGGFQGLQVVRVKAWEKYPWLLHGFSTRSGGWSDAYGAAELNLGFTKEDTPAAVLRNRTGFLQAVAGAAECELATIRQVHGTEVKVVLSAGPSAVPESGDGLVTDLPGVMLGIQVADCVPVLLADVKRRVVGAFHAGWRGTVAGIVGVGIERMRQEYGSVAEDLVGATGPCIRACCYAVGEEVHEAFAARFPYAEDLFERRERGDMTLDLVEANRRQMVEGGMAAERVSAVGECTACTRADGRRKYFSHRAEMGRTGRGMGIIGLAEG